MSKIITAGEYDPTKLTPDEIEQLLRLRGLRDEEIDTSDIPEIKEIPRDAVRGRFYRGPRVLLRPDLQQYFSELAERKGVPLSDLVNETLAKAVAVAEVAR